MTWKLVFVFENGSTTSLESILLKFHDKPSEPLLPALWSILAFVLGLVIRPSADQVIDLEHVCNVLYLQGLDEPYLSCC